MFGGNFVNRFNISGRAYKVIPQIKRVERLNPNQLNDVYVTGRMENSFRSVPSPRFGENGPTVVEPFAAVKCGDDQWRIAVAARSSAQAARNRGRADPAERLHGRLHRRVASAPCGRRQIPPAFGLAVTLIFLVLAAQFNSFRDPFIILLGSVPLALFGAMIFMFEKSGNPNLKFFTTVDNEFYIYSQVGLVTLVGLISKNGILIVEFANKLQQTDSAKSPRSRKPRESGCGPF